VGWGCSREGEKNPDREVRIANITEARGILDV
jgi:hypothetical protein